MGDAVRVDMGVYVDDLHSRFPQSFIEADYSESPQKNQSFPNGSTIFGSRCRNQEEEISMGISPLLLFSCAKLRGYTRVASLSRSSNAARTAAITKLEKVQSFPLIAFSTRSTISEGNRTVF